jgi:branched-chain amino acid transport system permease protein
MAGPLPDAWGRTLKLAVQLTFSALIQQILVGLSKTTILFIVSSGLSLVLGVLRIPNVSHGSLYMLGAFLAYSITAAFGGTTAGFFLALLLAPLAVALISLLAERALLCHLYDR